MAVDSVFKWTTPWLHASSVEPAPPHDAHPLLAHAHEGLNLLLLLSNRRLVAAQVGGHLKRGCMCACGRGYVHARLCDFTNVSVCV